jgi:tRNA U34 5-carboxymethylaminomethyl modifying GTPase MnmE/TrmE
MTILEAEAVNDLVHSQLEFERQVAIGNLMGKGAKYLQELRADLMRVRSGIESFI